MLDVTICLQKPVLEPSVETAALDPAQGIQNRMSIAETPPDSEILSLEFRIYSELLSFFSLYSRLLTDFLSHLGKWVKLIKFEAEN